jgi:hypothetical protein
LVSLANPQAMKESQLQRAIIETAELLGWRVMHQRPARRGDGTWMTAIEGHPGWPDLALLRPPRFLVVELKSVKGTLTHDQALWLNGFRASGIQTYVWRPADWESGVIEAILR